MFSNRYNRYLSCLHNSSYSFKGLFIERHENLEFKKNYLVNHKKFQLKKLAEKFYVNNFKY